MMNYWLGILTNVISIIAAIAATAAWYKRRQAKQRARFQQELRPIMEAISQEYGKTLGTDQIQTLVKTIVSRISQFQFGVPEPPVPEAPIEYASGTIVPCSVCRASDVSIEHTGTCPRCKLHSALWWGKREAAKSK
jgi:hypothetical protein